MDGTVFWTILTFVFVVATLAIVGGVFRYWWRAGARSADRRRSAGS